MRVYSAFIAIVSILIFLFDGMLINSECAKAPDHAISIQNIKKYANIADEKPASFDILEAINHMNIDDYYQSIEKQINNIEDNLLQERFNRITEALNKGHFNDAIFFCEEILEKYPDLWLPHYFLALSYGLTDRFDKALQEFDKTLAQYPNLTHAKLWKAFIHFKKGDFGKADELINAVLKIEKENISALLLLGGIKLINQDYEGCTQILQKALIKFPDYEDVYILLADVYKNTGRSDEALVKIDEYLNENPESDRVKVSKIDLLLHLKRTEEAELLYEDIFDNKKESFNALLIGFIIASAQEDYKRGLEFSNELVSKYPDSHFGLLAGLYTYIVRRDFVVASKLIKKMEEEFPLYPQMNKIKGFFYFEQEQYDEAAKYYQKALMANPDKPVSYKDLGWTYLENSKHKEALEVLKRGISLFPGDYLLHKFSGRVYRELGLYKKAIVEYQEAIQIFPYRIGAHAGLGTTYSLEGQYDLAIKKYQEAINLYPYHSEPYFGIADANLKKKNFQEAIKYAEMGITLSPDDGLSYQTLAEAYYKLGDNDKALKVCQDMKENTTLNAKGYIHLGGCLRRIGKPEEAIEAYTTSYKIAPSYNSQACIGYMYKKLGRFEDAIQAYQKAIAINPTNFKGYYSLGNLCLQLDQFDKAEDFYNTALTLNPQDSDSNIGLANVYHNRGLKEKAFNYYQKAFQLNPHNAAALFGRARYYAEKDQIDQAFRECNRAIEMDSEHIPSYHLRGKLFIKIGQHDKALAEFDKAIKINPKADVVYVNRGIIYEAKSRVDDAVREYEKAIAINPRNVIAYLALGNVHAKNGRFDHAIQLYEKGLEKGKSIRDMIHLCMAGAYQKKGDIRKAVHHYKKCIEINPSNFSANYNLGAIYGQSRLLDQALSYLNTGLKLRPEDLNTLNSIGYTYFQKKMFAEADRYYEKALQISPSFGLCHYNKAMNHYANRQFDLAIMHLDKAIECGYQGSPKFHEALRPYRRR